MPIWNLQDIKSRSSLVLALGFGILIALIAVLGFGALRRARAIYHEMESAQDSYLQMESFRRDIVTDMYLADILVRDYLLDPSPQNAARHRAELLSIRNSLQDRLDLLSQHIPDADNRGLKRLQSEVQAYWDSLDPIFDWTLQQKAEMSWSFLRHKVLPRRQAVVGLAHEVARLNDANLRREREKIQDSQDAFHRFLKEIMAFALALGALVALVTTYRVAVLERRHQEQGEQIQQTQDNLRRLSRRLVQAQEVERKALSRELHDEVGQTLTALGIELGNLEAGRNRDGDFFRTRIEEAKRLNSTAMRTIRDLAMGLRPSMLDDLGLEAALQWQGREFSRHTGVPASVQVHGALNDLNDAQQTCIYRVVQEALTNCARHAKAQHVLVTISEQSDGITVVVQDDGVGFLPAGANKGLGLVGIQERVQALEGRCKIVSRPSQGTTIRVELPLGVTA
ncbi:MAG: sensor histidine kinase [Chlamydiota bacterium]